MTKQQKNWLHGIFIAIAIIGLIINVGIVFLIGILLEIWHIWRIYQEKKGKGGSIAQAKKAKGAAPKPEAGGVHQNNMHQQPEHKPAQNPEHHQPHAAAQDHKPSADAQPKQEEKPKDH